MFFQYFFLCQLLTMMLLQLVFQKNSSLVWTLDGDGWWICPRFHVQQGLLIWSDLDFHPTAIIVVYFQGHGPPKAQVKLMKQGPFKGPFKGHFAVLENTQLP